MINPYGGPAFPVSDDQWRKEGMTLRDWFAGMALGSLITTLNNAPVSLKDGVTFEYAVSTAAYKMADAMIAERDKDMP